jgi:hypothetical protein
MSSMYLERDGHVLAYYRATIRRVAVDLMGNTYWDDIVWMSVDDMIDAFRLNEAWDVKDAMALVWHWVENREVSIDDEVAA